MNLTTSDESIAHYDDVKQNNLTVSFIPYKTGVTGGDFLIEDYFSWDKTVKPMVDKAIENSHHPLKTFQNFHPESKRGLKISTCLSPKKNLKVLLLCLTKS